MNISRQIAKQFTDIHVEEKNMQGLLGKQLRKLLPEYSPGDRKHSLPFGANCGKKEVLIQTKGALLPVDNILA